MADARIQTARFMLKWRDVERVRGSYDWSERDRLIGGLAAEGIRSVPFVWGSPQWIGNGAPGQPPLSTSGRQARLAELPQGGRGALQARRHLLGQQVQAGLRSERPAVPIQSWQIWNEPNLKKYFTPGSTTQAAAQKYAQLLALADAAIAARDPQAKVVLAGMPSVPDANGSSNAWDFLDALYTVAGVKADFDVAALHPYGCNLDQTRTGISQIQRLDEEPRRRADAAVADRVRLGIGGARPVLQEQGPCGPAQPADQLLQPDPAEPQELERAAPVLVPVARRRSRGPSSPGTAASAAARGCCATTAPRSPPTPRSGATRPRPPRRWRGSSRGRRREASATTRPRTSPSARTRPARPSSAASTRPPSSPAPRR